MDKESPEERLRKVEIKPVEKDCLDRVFNFLCISLFHNSLLGYSLEHTRRLEKEKDYIKRFNKDLVDVRREAH